MTATPAQEQVRDLGWGWWLVVLVGVLSIVAGLIIVTKPSSSLATLAVIAGVFLLVDGILELIASFTRSTDNRGLVALLGVLTAVIGVLLIYGTLAILVGIGFILNGVGLIGLGWGIREVRRAAA